MTALPTPSTAASGTAIHVQNGNVSHLTPIQASLIASPRTSASVSGPPFDLNPTLGNNKRKRRPAGTPDPDAEVVALSPKTLMESDRYVCEICSQGFQRDQNLQMHRRRHKVPWKLLKRSSPEVRKRVYVCPEPSCLHHDPCHALGDLVGIKKHYRRKHSCDKQWKCEKCSKGYAVQSDYKAHLKTCGTRGHCCDCGRVFSRVESFIEHQDACSAAREKTAIASSDQTSMASLSARNASPSPSADTVSVTNRSGGSVAGLARSLDFANRYEVPAWLMEQRELQLLPARQHVESSQGSVLGSAVDQEVEEPAKRLHVGKEQAATFFHGSPTAASMSVAAISSHLEPTPPRLQLSIGLYLEAGSDMEGNEGFSTCGTGERLAISRSGNLLPASPAGDVSETGRWSGGVIERMGLELRGSLCNGSNIALATENVCSSGRERKDKERVMIDLEVADIPADGRTRRAHGEEEEGEVAGAEAQLAEARRIREQPQAELEVAKQGLLLQRHHFLRLASSSSSSSNRTCQACGQTLQQQIAAAPSAPNAHHHHAAAAASSLKLELN